MVGAFPPPPYQSLHTFVHAAVAFVVDLVAVAAYVVAVPFLLIALFGAVVVVGAAFPAGGGGLIIF